MGEFKTEGPSGSKLGFIEICALSTIIAEQLLSTHTTHKCASSSTSTSHHQHHAPRTINLREHVVWHQSYLRYLQIMYEVAGSQ